MSDFYKKLCDAAGSDSVRENELMSMHTTFRAGGPARYFVTADDEQKLAAVIKTCRDEDEAFYILGNGSNLLVSDDGYDGVMILLGEKFTEIHCQEGEHGVYELGAGVLLSRAARRALQDKMAGFEFAAGIPGTVGGAVVMNAGAYGGELKDVIENARVMTRDGDIKVLPVEQLKLGYRSSCIAEMGYIVLSARIHLHEGDSEEIGKLMDDLAVKRREKQPLEYPSAGSTFKRPEGYFAGKLIEDAGLRGYREGGAQVSEKHCGFVINRDHATASDIAGLCKTVQNRVYEKFGVRLETEIKMLGFKEGK